MDQPTSCQCRHLAPLVSGACFAFVGQRSTIHRYRRFPRSLRSAVEIWLTEILDLGCEIIVHIIRGTGSTRIVQVGGAIHLDSLQELACALVSNERPMSLHDMIAQPRDESAQTGTHRSRWYLQRDQTCLASVPSCRSNYRNPNLLMDTLMRWLIYSGFQLHFGQLGLEESHSTILCLKFARQKN